MIAAESPGCDAPALEDLRALGLTGDTRLYVVLPCWLRHKQALVRYGRYYHRTGWVCIDDRYGYDYNLARMWRASEVCFTVAGVRALFPDGADDLKWLDGEDRFYDWSRCLSPDEVEERLSPRSWRDVQKDCDAWLVMREAALAREAAWVR